MVRFGFGIERLNGVEMDCCSVGAEQIRRDVCPDCGTLGRKVQRITLKSLLTSMALERLSAGNHYFCSTPTCTVVYYSRGEVFQRNEVRVPVFVKEPPGQRLLCYCFEVAEHEIDGADDERIRNHVQAGRCACEVRNPEGTCCLGYVVRALRNSSGTERSWEGAASNGREVKS